MSQEPDQWILGYFIEEGKDHLNTIEQGLLNLQNIPRRSGNSQRSFPAATR